MHESSHLIRISYIYLLRHVCLDLWAFTSEAGTSNGASGLIALPGYLSYENGVPKAFNGGFCLKANHTIALRIIIKSGIANDLH